MASSKDRLRFQPLNAESKPQSNTLLNLQALRAIAAFMVVIYHARDLTSIGSMVPFAFGNAGVDIFFFISGFIIAHASMPGDVGQPVRFLVKRIVRIVPMYWLLTIAIFAIAQAVPSMISAGGAPSFENLAKSLFFIPYFNPENQILPIVYMGWTLNYEMFFYLLCCLALLMDNQLHRLLFISAILGCLSLTGLIVSPEGAIGQTYTDLLMFEFVIGMWLSVAYRALPQTTIGIGGRAILLAIGFTAFAGLIWAEIRWPEATRELKWGIPAFFIVVTALALEKFGAQLKWQWVQSLGEASYAIYLSHAIIIKVAALIFPRFGLESLISQIASLLALYVFIGVSGILFHTIVERRLIMTLRGWLLKEPQAVVSTRSCI